MFSVQLILYSQVFLFCSFIHLTGNIFHLFSWHLALHQTTMAIDSNPQNERSLGHAAQSPPASNATQSSAAFSDSSFQKPSWGRDMERDLLVRKLVGRKVRVPNLMSFMPAWPKDIHPKEVLDEVNEEIDEWLKT